ncbi:MAG: AraC family transcriptional regulator ligand-binding domain-containing protein [Polyangiaceae bacterium]
MAGFSVPAAHAAQLVDLVRRWNIPGEALFETPDYPLAELTAPHAQIPLETYIRVFERARALTGEPAIGVLTGLRMRVSAHGYVGLAVMNAPTLGKSVQLAIRYAPTRTGAFGFEGRVEGGAANLTVIEHADLGPARDSILLSLLIGLWQIGCANTGTELPVSMSFAIPEPAYFGRFVGALPPTRFDQPANQLCVADLSVLATPLQTADAESLHLVAEQCERLLTSLMLKNRMGPRVRGLLARTGVYGLREAAKSLCVSTRTLRRQLASEGVSFSDIVDDDRKQRALLLVQSGELSLLSVAERLGYSDTSNFARAFRRWTGKTPSAYRLGRP